ncbi:putative ankyrin repeat domain-containing protein 31 isoform X2 [Oryzias latipes]|uniref:putative ankyrin repeat domain-containing protein 31 isoform X2 n=1 Tax=Oryzias latipes TaxID=8090 RepID=UPI000CE1E254|nr:putative ankyrin repeat domain-containing protein 31 isoform X2 [Oryzias latipes]
MLQTDDGQSSCSDDDSVSLLRDLACSQVTDATVDMTAPSGSRCPITPNMETSPKQAQSGEEDESFGRRQCEAGLGEPAEVEKVCKDLKTLNQRQLHKRDSKGETLLHKACRKNNPAEVRMLLQAGISVNMEDYAGWTALHEAAAMGHVTVVEELLKAGATTNARCRGVTPLHDAVCAGHRQVVKLLLEGGSNPRDRNGGGVSALEMADDEEMKELLLTFTAAPAKGERQTGAASSAPRCTRPAHLQVREAGEGPGNLQLMKVSAADLRNSLARRATLEKLKGKQREMRAWRLTGGRSADRFQAACVQIQSVLRDVLSKQRLEKDALCRRFQKVSGSFRRRVLRTHLLSLASCQRTLLEVLQKQLHLEETFAAARTELQAPPPAVQYKSVTGERMEQTPGELGEETGTSCPSGEEDDRSGPLGCPITRGGKPPPHRGLQSNTTGFCRKTFLQQVKVKGQSRTKVSSRPLGLLIQGGALAPGSALQLLWKVRPPTHSDDRKPQSWHCFLLLPLSDNVPS